MSNEEMQNELAEAANDMGYIARRAQIAAGNLRAVTDALPPIVPGDPYSVQNKVLAIKSQCYSLAAVATVVKQSIEWTLAEFSKGEAKEGGAAKEGGEK